MGYNSINSQLIKQITNKILTKEYNVAENILEFLGTEFIVDEEFARYNTVRLYFEQIGLDARQEFMYKYSEYANLDDVAIKAYDDGIEIIQKYIEIVVSNFVDLGFYNINEDIFISQYYIEDYDWDETFNEINDQYMDIVLTEEQKDEYRRLRKAGRGRWQGGGFGLEGALKGAATAGALNLATGAVHSIVNMGGKLISSISANNKKKKIFDDPTTSETLADGIYFNVRRLMFAYIKFIHEKYNIGFRLANPKEADVIFGNIKNRNLDVQQDINVLKEIMSLNPYNYAVYEYILRKYGDEEYALEEFADYFGVNLEYIKESMVEVLFNTFKFETEHEAINDEIKINLMCESLGIINCKYSALANEKVQEFDLIARTIDGKVYESRHEADAVRKDKNSLEKIINKLDKQDKQSLLNAKMEIEHTNFKTDVYVETLSEINSILDEMEKQERTVNIRGLKKTYDSIEEAKKVKEDVNSMEIIMSEIKEDSAEEFTKGKQRVQESECHKDVKERYLYLIDDSLKNIDERTRTVNGIVYDDVTTAELAAQEAKKIEQVLGNLSKEKYSEQKLLKMKKAVEDLHCQTNIDSTYIEVIDEKINEINEENEELAEELDKRKEEYRGAIAGTILVCVIGGYFFFKVGTILKIVIIFFFVSAIIQLFDDRKKLKESKKASKRLKKK